MSDSIIGIDSRMVRSTGIGTYLRNILEQMQTHRALIDKVTLFGSPEYEKDFRFKTSAFVPPIYSISEQLKYGKQLRKCQLWHAPHYNIPFFKPKNTKLVVTIHDLIHWVFKNEYFSKAQNIYAYVMLNAAVHKSDHIITVSEHTKKDLIAYFNAPEEKITVIYEGVESHFKPVVDYRNTLKKYGLPDKYFLHVGSLKPHKNLHTLIKRFRKWHRKQLIQTPLVLVGKKDSSYKAQYRELSELKSDSTIIHVNNVEAIQELVDIYNGANALIHPSLYEGFGLTLLEAMACGTPVITSPNASIPEVVGENAYLVDSDTENDMMHAVQELETNDEIRSEWSQKGLAHVKNFSWKKAASETLAVYSKVLEKNIEDE